MGFNTSALILNDTIADLKKDPVKFVDALVRAVSSGGEYLPSEDYSHVVKLLPSFHADNAAVVVASGNTAAMPYITHTGRFNPHNREDVLTLLYAVALKYGYKLVPE
jgi:hypothetical protein